MTQEQLVIIACKTRSDVTTHEQTIICRQLFAGHVADSRLIERKEETHRMIKRSMRQSPLQEIKRRLQNFGS